MIKEYNLHKGFLVSYSWEAAMENLSAEDLGNVVRILMKYQSTGGSEFPELGEMSEGAKMFCLCVLPQINNRIENAENGRKGGRPRREEANSAREENTDEVSGENKNPPFQNETEGKNPPSIKDESDEKLKISKDKLSQDKSSQAKSSSSSPVCDDTRERAVKEEEEEEENAEKKRHEKSNAERDAAFTAFMAEYPKKYRVAEARRMFDELCVCSTDELLSLLSRWKKCDNWQKDGGRYIPSPDKFLREIYGFRLEPEKREHSGSFDTEDFFQAALKRSYNEPFFGETLAAEEGGV
ncbi:MAG: hypothetical protein IKV54_02100 [Clostridia bacterium]|nr:hypothetical protein [Clostridia bacterium]